MNAFNSANEAKAKFLSTLLFMFIIFGAAGSGSSAYAGQVNPADIINPILNNLNEAIRRGEVIDRARKDWAQVDQRVQVCLIQNYNMSPRAYAEQGVEPTQVSGEISNCQKYVMDQQAQEAIKPTMNLIAHLLAERIEAARLNAITVLDFTNLAGRRTQLGGFLAGELSDEFVNLKEPIVVVDRTNVQFLLQERGLTVDGLLDPRTGPSLGRLVGADTIVIGTVTPPTNSGVHVSVRAIALEPIQEVRIHGQTVDLVKRRSMSLIMARRMKAATVEV